MLAGGILLGGGLAWMWTGARPGAVGVSLFIGATVASWSVVGPRVWRSVRQLRADMNLLMTVAVTGAMCLGDWPEAASVAWLFALAEIIEARSVRRARGAIHGLLERAPRTARVRRESGTEDVAVAQVPLGALVEVRPGQAIPLDGVVNAGHSSVMEATITGESTPAEKSPGSAVFAGTINGQGLIEFRVTHTADHTVLARIVQMVEESLDRRAPAQRLVDRLASWYTPLVLTGAVCAMVVPPLAGIGEWREWIYRGLVLLVISCPCALVISTPVAVVSALTALARRGILVKGGAYLEELGRLTTMALDKTGTVTAGKPVVTGVVPLNGTSEGEVLRIAAALSCVSQHPLSQAVASFAATAGARAFASASRTMPGLGTTATIGGHEYFLGSHRLAHEVSVCDKTAEDTLSAIEARGESVVIVGHQSHDDCPGRLMGVVALKDTIRPEAGAAMAELSQLGLRLELLSGDADQSVASVARTVGIATASGGLLPQDKAARVKSLREAGERVGMAGDGINDAPAMAEASVGVALGTAASDVAMETADVALMTADLRGLPAAVRAGRRTLAVIRQNVAFAIAVKMAVLLLTLAGVASMWLAIMADTGATLVVIGNSLRMLRS